MNKLRAVFNDGKIEYNPTFSHSKLIRILGSDIDFNITKPDPHAVGTLLKMYLRERKVACFLSDAPY